MIVIHTHEWLAMEFLAVIILCLKQIL